MQKYFSKLLQSMLRRQSVGMIMEAIKKDLEKFAVATPSYIGHSPLSKEYGGATRVRRSELLNHQLRMTPVAASLSPQNLAGE